MRGNGGSGGAFNPKSGGLRVKPGFFSRIGDKIGFTRRSVATQLFLRGDDLDSASAPMSRPFEKSVWVQRAIKEVSGPIAAVEMKFYQGDTEITAAPWLEFWKKPVRNLAQADFIEALVGWLKLAGEAFIILPPEFAGKFPEVKKGFPPLILIRPDSMKALKDDQGNLTAWEYRDGRGRRSVFPPEQVIQPRYWNPYDDIRGMSEYESARIATEADYLAGKFALNLSRANGDTGIIVSVKAGTSLDDGQQNQITDALRLKQHRSQRGEFSSVFVPADLEVQDPKIRATDAQFVAQRLENRHEIYIAFGVPPSMADVMASYSVGSASDWYRLITGTCMPAAAKIADAIGEIASRMHGSPVEACFEFDEHPVMQQVRRERIDAGTKLWDRGMPWRNVSEYLDLELPQFEGDDTGYISFGLAPVGEVAALPDAAADPNLAEPDPMEQMKLALRSGAASPKPAHDCDCCSFDFASLAVRAGDSHDVKLWKALMAKRRETMRAYESKFGAVLMNARRQVLRKLEFTLEPKSVSRAVAADFMFNLEDFSKLFHAQMRQTAVNALQSAGTQLMAEIGKNDPWKMPQAEALEFLKSRENKLSGVPQDVFDRIRDTISDGLEEGSTLKEIASAVRGEFNDINEARSRVIASTETAAAYGKGRQLALEQSGTRWKKWITSGNANVRAAHRAMNGTIAAIDEEFVVLNLKTGETDSVLHPADSDGAPWNVINCHCVEIAVAQGPQGEAEPAT